AAPPAPTGRPGRDRGSGRDPVRGAWRDAGPAARGSPDRTGWEGKEPGVRACRGRSCSRGRRSRPHVRPPQGRRATARACRIDRPVGHTELPVGIDTEFFAPSPLPDRAPDRQPLIGYSGRISMEKNVGEILAAARELSACDFLIVGEGPRRAALEARAPPNVVFRDFLPRKALPRFYSTIDAFVTASTADTLGLSTLEANACGTPVAAPDVAPFSETIGPDNGVRYERGDTAAMAGAIDQCVSGSWSTRAAVAEYAVDETIAALERIYERLLAGGSGTRTAGTTP
ncbi:hypothetical protein BRC62_08230, partial [Halobacteriales archaeon QH_10_67_13]